MAGDADVLSDVDHDVENAELTGESADLIDGEFFSDAAEVDSHSRDGETDGAILSPHFFPAGDFAGREDFGFTGDAHGLRLPIPGRAEERQGGRVEYAMRQAMTFHRKVKKFDAGVFVHIDPIAAGVGVDLSDDAGGEKSRIAGFELRDPIHRPALEFVSDCWRWRDEDQIHRRAHRAECDAIAIAANVGPDRIANARCYFFDKIGRGLDHRKTGAPQ